MPTSWWLRKHRTIKHSNLFGINTINQAMKDSHRVDAVLDRRHKLHMRFVTMNTTSGAFRAGIVPVSDSMNSPEVSSFSQT